MKFRSALLAALLAGALLTSPLAAAQQWTALGPFGGPVDSLTVDPTNDRVLYVATAEGVFTSADGGGTWLPIHAGIASGNVAVDPSRPATIYLSIGPRIARSDDGGAHWTESRRGLGPRSFPGALAVDPAKRSRIYLAAAGAWHSLDGGMSWRPARKRPLPQGDASLVSALVAVPRPAGTVFAATFGGLFKSGDGGDTWRRSSSGLPAGEIGALALAPSDPKTLWVSLPGSGVFRSTDGGLSWRITAAQPAGPIFGLTVSPTSPRTAWAGTLGKGIYRTTDGGASWSPAGPGPTAQVQAVAAGGRTLYAAVDPQGSDPGGVLASDDGGATWQSRNRGFAGVEARDLAVSPRDPGDLWAALSLGLVHSDDGGLSWEPVSQLPPVLPPTGPPIQSLAFPADGATLYALTNGRIWATELGATSWHPLPGDAAGPVFIGILRTHPDDPATLYAGNPVVIGVSHDAGATWRSAGIDLGCGFNDLAIAPSNPATLYAAGARSTPIPFRCQMDSAAALFRSTDGGATWTSAAAGLAGSFVEAVAVDPVDPRTLYAATGDALWKSTDGGDHWARTGAVNPPITALFVWPGSGAVWAAGPQGQILASHDAGSTWQPVASPQTAFIRRFIPDPTDLHRLYAVTSGGIWVLEDQP
ncbi:MAG: hypothetical protein QOF89_1187 [Acidobacteriota bacterium]|jgi:photosystem II stability/assembly factor-like uncharacterized protein|nr:hypothetical protein [Acidobacteriota bacterium]